METSPPRPPHDQLNEGSFAMSVDAPPLPSLPEGWSDLARRVDVMAVEQRVDLRIQALEVRFDDRFVAAEKRADDRFASLEKRLDERFLDVDRQFLGVHQRFQLVEQRFNALAHEIGELRAELKHEIGDIREDLRELRSLRTTIVVTALSLFVGLAGLGFGFVQIALRA